jgi:hypothetical protein
MDVRLSPEQQALRDGAAQVADRLGPKAVGQLGEPSRRAKLGAAVDESGWRELRLATEGGAPLASGVEPAIVAEELGRGLADTSFLGPTLAAELRRLAGAPPSEVAETVVLGPDLAELARSDGADDAGGVAIDAQDCARALFLVPGPLGSVLAQVDLAGAPGGVDLTLPSIVLHSFSGYALVEGAPRCLSR